MVEKPQSSQYENKSKGNTLKVVSNQPKPVPGCRLCSQIHIIHNMKFLNFTSI